MRWIRDLESRDAAEGLAIDEALLDRARAGGADTVRLWVARRAVIVGRSQSVESECDTDLLTRLGIPVLRRISGGGAVYVYPGNLNVSVACSDARPLGTVSEAFAWLAAAVAAAARRLGVPADPAARSVVVRGAKIAGLAQARRASAVLVHSTLLVEPDKLDMARFLRAMRDGYAPRGTSSTPSPVTTLTGALGRSVTIEEATAALRWAFEPERVGPATWGDLTAEEADAARRLAGTRYRSRAWNERTGKTS